MVADVGWRTAICGFLQFSAKICASAVSCALHMLECPGEGVNLRKSASWASLSPYFRPLKAPWSLSFGCSSQGCAHFLEQQDAGFGWTFIQDAGKAKPQPCKPSALGNEKWGQPLLAQTFWNSPGVRDTPAKFPEHPRFSSSKPKERENFQVRERSSQPLPLRVEDPHPTRQPPGPTNEYLCSFILPDARDSRGTVVACPLFFIYPWKRGPRKACMF